MGTTEYGKDYRTFTPRYPLLSRGAVLWVLDLAFAMFFWAATVAFLFYGSLPQTWMIASVVLLPPAAFLLFLYAFGLYRRPALLETRRSFGRILLAAGLTGLLTTASAAIVSRSPDAPRPEALCVAALLSLPLAGVAARIGLYTICRRGLFHRRILIVGAGRRAWDLAWLLQHQGNTLSYDLMFAAVSSMGEVDPRLAHDPRHRILPASQGFLAVARQFDADQIVVAPDERRGTDIEALLACKSAGFPVSEYLTFLEREIRRVDLKCPDLSWLLYADDFTIGPIDRALKRCVDVVASAALLVLTAPFLLAAAAAVKLQDGGPILYRQTRVTLHGRKFRILKLRSMGVEAERNGIVWAMVDDPRITRVGSILRQSRLDELPQLLNVLRGDMSFVGPRPERPEFVTELAAKLPLYHQRHLVKAGLTGWAQVNYPYGASLNDARSKLSYDLYYAKNFSIVFDILIILQTIRVILWPDGVR